MPKIVAYFMNDNHGSVKITADSWDMLATDLRECFSEDANGLWGQVKVDGVEDDSLKGPYRNLAPLIPLLTKVEKVKVKEEIAPPFGDSVPMDTYEPGTKRFNDALLCSAVAGFNGALKDYNILRVAVEESFKTLNPSFVAWHILYKVLDPVEYEKWQKENPSVST